MDEKKYECLKLQNQLCFPLYACSKEVVRRYKPLLDRLDLTYTQYITMMVLWEKKEMNVKEIGEALYLDSGTLTPLLKKLEQKGYVTRKRSEADERSILIKITDEGESIKDEALKVPEEMAQCIELDDDESAVLYKLLYKILDKVRES